MKVGDRVFLSTRDGAERIPARVVLASDNGRSLIIEFEAVVDFPGGAYVGKMPVLQLDDGRWIEILGSHQIKLDVAQ